VAPSRLATLSTAPDCLTAAGNSPPADSRFCALAYQSRLCHHRRPERKARAIRFPTGSADHIDLRPADELASCEWRTAGGVFNENNIR